MRVELIIHALPTLPNRLLGAHWRTRSGHAAKWKRLVGDSLAHWMLSTTDGQRMVYYDCPLEHAHITFTRCSPRSCDFDGLVGSFKPVADSLVHHRVIEDDSPKHIDCSYEWLKTPTKEQCVRIVVEGI